MYFLYRIIAVIQEKTYTKFTKEVIKTFEKKYHLYLTEEERNQIIGSLVELRNSLIRSRK